MDNANATFADHARELTSNLQFSLLRTKTCPLTGLIVLDPVEVPADTSEEATADV